MSTHNDSTSSKSNQKLCDQKKIHGIVHFWDWSCNFGKISFQNWNEVLLNQIKKILRLYYYNQIIIGWFLVSSQYLFHGYISWLYFQMTMLQAKIENSKPIKLLWNHYFAIWYHVYYWHIIWVLFNRDFFSLFFLAEWGFPRHVDWLWTNYTFAVYYFVHTQQTSDQQWN